MIIAANWYLMQWTCHQDADVRREHISMSPSIHNSRLRRSEIHFLEQKQKSRTSAMESKRNNTRWESEISSLIVVLLAIYSTVTFDWTYFDEIHVLLFVSVSISSARALKSTCTSSLAWVWYSHTATCIANSASSRECAIFSITVTFILYSCS